MPSADKRLLEQCTILMTRPRHQTSELQQLLEAHGARLIDFPVIEIRPLDSSDESFQALNTNIIAQLDRYNIAIFVSSNAVEQAHAIVNQERGQWPKQLRLAAIGAATTNALKQRGLQVDIEPVAPFDSEALLALLTMQQVRGQRIVIFRGVGGREKLAAALKQLGATVDYAEVYSRQRPSTSLNDLTDSERKNISTIIAASNESLQNLYDIAGETWRSWLLNKPVAVISQRCGELARQLKFKHYCIASKASKEGLMEAVLACCKQYPVEDRDD